MNKESYNFIEKYDRSSEKNSEKISISLNKFLFLLHF